MCIPLLVGTAATTAGAAAAGGSLAMAMGGATTGLLGSAGVFAPLSGSIATGIGSMFSGMGAGSAFNLAGAGISAAGSLYQGAIAEGNYQYQAGMMAYNKKISENNALMARRASEFDADAFDLERRRLISSQRVGFGGKSGVVIDEGTPDAVALETETQGSLERLAILYKGETQADAYLQQATGQEAAAARYRTNAATAMTSAGVGAAKELATAGYRQYRYGAGTSLLGD